MDIAFHRHFTICYMTDGRRWQFFRVERLGSGELRYLMGPVFEDNMRGWRYYVWLLMARLEDIGYLEPLLENAKLISVLGKGGSAFVYKGVYEEQSVAVKIFKIDNEECSIAEENALKTLEHVAGVPNFVATATIENSKECGVWRKAILSTPVGQQLDSKWITGSHLRELVFIVKSAHDKGLLHRDIKPANIIFFKEKIFLIDWSASVSGDLFEEAPWVGSPTYGVTQAEQIKHRWSGETCDLIALVRTSYSLVNMTKMPAYDVCKEIDASVWNEALKFAVRKAYDELGAFLFGVKFGLTS